MGFLGAQKTKTRSGVNKARHGIHRGGGGIMLWHLCMFDGGYSTLMSKVLRGSKPFTGVYIFKVCVRVDWVSQCN